MTKQFPLGLEVLPVFQPVMQAANRIWNSCVWHSRETFKQENRWPTEAELKAKFKSFAAWRELHSQSAQAVVEEYFEAVSAYRKHRENGRLEMNPPNFKSKNYLRTVTWKRQGFDVKDNTLVLKLSRKKEPIKVALPEGWNVVVLPDGTEVKGIPVEVKVKAVVRRHRVENLVLHVTLDLGVVPVNQVGAVSAYDYNSAMFARAVSSGRLDLFVCRELLSLVQYRNKTIAGFQEKMSCLKEGSRRWKRCLSAKIRKLKKLDRRIRQMEHALTKLFAELDGAEGVTFAVVGDLTDLRRSARTGMKSRKATQKINQMAYDRLRQEQRYKNLVRGIETDTWTERNTSSTCCLCGARNPAWRRHRGLWVCGECGLVLQADLNGAANLLKQYLFGNCTGKELPFTLKEVRVWRWDGRLNRFAQVSPRAA
ncbi:transposase, IS605 OrfB family [Ammonifex degensii KC4]|uniref:Transposase, IS605 OrfB family n=1 Tax=Ammonifex degensii (strain DSM 10501 / KC4) TaxID=429009 RepID=C9R8S2_AMMDK|nr:RNA-guided endonuclease TnpB family protein [Ammonifex degensii]ACX52701.1 transposase, IS605 OrfB family [Ammonifex degensii KC4]